MSDTSEAKVNQNTVDRAMLTRSGKVLPAVELTGSTIPKDRPIKWAWGNSKKGKSKARLEAYRNATMSAVVPILQNEPQVGTAVIASAFSFPTHLLAIDIAV